MVWVFVLLAIAGALGILERRREARRQAEWDELHREIMESQAARERERLEAREKERAHNAAEYERLRQAIENFEGKKRGER